MKLHKSFIAKFVQASLFSCLSFSAYAQDVNSEENKPLVPSNEKEYEAAKASITEHINNAVDRIKKEEEKIVYDRKVEGKSVFSDGNESVSGLYNKPIDGGPYLFALQSLRPPVNNLKLINITDIASTTEVFSTRWGQNGQYGSGVNNLAYIENTGNITGKGTGPSNNQPAIYLISGNDFYLKNSGKITSAQDTSEIHASNNLVLENDGSKSMLDKFEFTGKNIFLSNNKNSLLANSSVRAYENLIFSNKGVIGPRNDTPMTLDEFIKVRGGGYEDINDNANIKRKYDEYLKDLNRKLSEKRKEFIAAKDEYIAKNYGTEEFVPYKDYKKKIDEYSSRPGNSAISMMVKACTYEELTHGGCKHEPMVSTKDLFRIDVDTLERSFEPLTIDEFVKKHGKECGKECEIQPDKRTKENYDNYIKEFKPGKTKIYADNLSGENTGKVLGTLDMTFSDGYFINSGEIDKLDLTAYGGLFVNRGTALLKIDGFIGTLTVDLKNSTVLEGSIIDRGSAKTRVIVNEETKIDGVLKANGSNETLVVSRDKNSELHNVEAGMDKYVGFEHLEMQGKWEIKEHDAEFNKSITFNEANVELADKKLISPKVTNTASSTINVTSNAEVKGNFTNRGTVSLTGTLTTSGNVENSGTIEFNHGLQGTKFVTTGNYTTGTGEKSLLKMNVDASAGKSEFDLLDVGGKASGTTKIEFIDPTKLAAKMKNRVKLVKTQSSDENAFSLVESKYGRYKYKFYNVAHDTDGYSNWYLEQLPTFRKEVAGIVSGFAASQNLFTHTFHDRAAKDKLPEEHTAWVRVYHHNTKYQLNGVDSKADAYSDTLQLGYDALKYNKGTNKFTAGAYVSLGRQKSETYLVEDDERVRSISKGYSLGLYAT